MDAGNDMKDSVSGDEKKRWGLVDYMLLTALAATQVTFFLATYAHSRSGALGILLFWVLLGTVIFVLKKIGKSRNG